MIQQTLNEEVQQLRICLAFHSYIYYEIGTSVIPDNKWDVWALRLKVLQDRYGDSYDIKYDDWFKDWDGTTGFLLCSIPGLRQSVKKVYPELIKE